MTQWNLMYPLSARKPNARYVGEIYAADSLAAVREALEPQSIRFVYDGDSPNDLYQPRAPAASRSSPTTRTTAWATSTSTSTTSTPSQLGDPLGLDADEQGKLERAAALQAEHGITDLVLGLDHMATRILAGDRERRDPRVPDDGPVLLLGRLQHRRDELLDQRHAPSGHRRRQEVAGPGVHGEQHAGVRELVREPADADGGLRPQLRPPDAPHGLRGAGRSRRRREERRLRRAPAR